eukprot:560197-Lingulodinium_polyedra.AAC.2
MNERDLCSKVKDYCIMTRCCNAWSQGPQERQDGGEVRARVQRIRATHGSYCDPQLRRKEAHFQ